jgi:CubicO group peptidase (beta-lactamase class C family)
MRPAASRSRGQPISRRALAELERDGLFRRDSSPRRSVALQQAAMAAAGYDVHGHCDPRFEAVRDAFAANFEAGAEVGASFAATVEGELVVDLWAGHADAARTRPWERDTIVNVFSTTKAMTALCANMLADRGLLDFDAPVARYWPEFAQNGKERLPVRWLLSHQAGLAAIRETLPLEALFDWERMAGALARESPWWTPGTGNGYHAMTYGYLVGEVVRRITGKSLGTFFRDEVARPLAADFHIGLPASEDARVAELVPPTAAEARAAGARAPAADSLTAKVLSNPPLRAEFANRPEWRRAENPAAGGHGNARSVARVLAALACGGAVDGVRLLDQRTLARAIDEQVRGKDLVLGFDMRWGLGFMLTSEALPFGPNPRTFGHGGWGGSLGFADLDARVSWSYVMNKMSPGTAGDARGIRLVPPLYAAL